VNKASQWGNEVTHLSIPDPIPHAVTKSRTKKELGRKQGAPWRETQREDEDGEATMQHNAMQHNATQSTISSLACLRQRLWRHTSRSKESFIIAI
jgi:hypothetical protein